MRMLCVAIITVALLAGSAIGVTGQEEELFGPMAPARVMGEFVHEGIVSEGTVEELGELMVRTEGAVSAYRWTSSDPRLGGHGTATGDWTGWYPPALVAAFETIWMIENEQGTWSGSSRGVASIGDEDPVNTDEQVVLVGSGAYEGLTAYLVLDGDAETFLGAIIPAEMPELPDDWLAAYQSVVEEAGREAGDPSMEQDVSFPIRDIVVAAREIEAGETIEATMLVLRSVPADVTNAASATDPQEVVGSIAAVPIFQFQPITSNLLVSGK